MLLSTLFQNLSMCSSVVDRSCQFWLGYNAVWVENIAETIKITRSKPNAAVTKRAQLEFSLAFLSTNGIYFPTEFPGIADGPRISLGKCPGLP